MPETVRRWNRNRLLLTETQPYELPAFISNQGFKSHLEQWTGDQDCLRDRLLELILNESTTIQHSSRGGALGSHSELLPLVKRTTPLRYRIARQGKRSRRLWLLHPSSQLSISEAIFRFDQILIQRCSTSPFSLRRPVAVASSYTYPAYASVESFYRDKDKDTHKQEDSTSGVASYFAYEDFTLLYKFFESSQFAHLESRWRCMLELDISRCFESIYTHAIEWALHGREFSKVQSASKPSFGGFIDFLTRQSNDAETNGIPIGPEYSRVVAEMFLQAIEAPLSAREGLSRKHFGRAIKYGVDFDVKRYVDNYYIFSNDPLVAESVREELEARLQEFNLSLNAEKETSYRRPFTSETSSSLSRARPVVEEFLQSAHAQLEHQLESEKGDTARGRDPIHQSAKALRLFLRDLRSALSPDLGGYGAVASFVSGRLRRSVLGICKRVSKAPHAKHYVSGATLRWSLASIIRAAFHIYAVSPSPSRSIQIATMCIVASRTIEQLYPSEHISFQEDLRVSLEMTLGELHSINLVNPADAPIDQINFLALLSCLDTSTSISLSSINAILGSSKEWGYFEIMGALYSLCLSPVEGRCPELLTACIDAVERNLLNSEFKFMDSQYIHTLLDCIACPVIPEDFKLRLLEKADLIDTDNAVQVSAARQSLKGALAGDWFVSWKQLDFLRHLSRKQLTVGYA